MTTINDDDPRLTTTADGFTTGHALYGTHGEEVRVTVCDVCGSVVLKLDHHREQCPRIMPPKPEPITPDRHEWAKIVHAHRAERVSYKPDAGVACICGKFRGAPFGHSQHVAAMIANWVEANR